MRPVFKGECPKKANDEEVAFKEPRLALPYLEARIGKYCCYCERRLPIGLETEHVSPKSKDRANELEWSNFLLGCKTCNTVKATKKLKPDSVLWPDQDNTSLAFSYTKSFVRICTALEKADPNHSRAQNLIDLVGLDRNPGPNFPDPTDRDSRWEDREKIWAYAELTKQRHPIPDDEAAHYIAKGASLMGCFSVWMAVFANCSKVRTALITAFQGTASDCFDANGNPISRPSGRL